MGMNYALEQQMLLRMNERNRRMSDQELERRAIENIQRTSQRGLIRQRIGFALMRMEGWIDNSAQSPEAQTGTSGV